jgi:hypothetical protein
VTVACFSFEVCVCFRKFFVLLASVLHLGSSMTAVCICPCATLLCPISMALLISRNQESDLHVVRCVQLAFDVRRRIESCSVESRHYGADVHPDSIIVTCREVKTRKLSSLSMTTACVWPTATRCSEQ